MAFKMAKGSLFAMLLRSKWWYSVSIGLFFLSASLLLTDAQYVALSISGALPFFAIGAFAGYKQFQLPSNKRVLEVSELVQKMPSASIAQKIADNYIKHDYQADIFKGSDADLLISRGSLKLLLCCKRLKVANTGIGPLKLLVAAGAKIDATGYLYVALGEISTTARDYAAKNSIQLIDANTLAAFFSGKAKID